MRCFLWSVVAFGLMMAFCAFSYAGGAPDPTSDPVGWFEFMTSAFTARDWMALTGALSYGLVYAIRHEKVHLVKWFPKLGTQSGGYLLAFVTGLLWALAGGLVAHLGWRASIEQAIVPALAAIGAWQTTKDVKAKPGKPPPVTPLSIVPPGGPS